MDRCQLLCCILLAVVGRAVYLLKDLGVEEVGQELYLKMYSALNANIPLEAKDTIAGS